MLRLSGRLIFPCIAILIIWVLLCTFLSGNPVVPVIFNCLVFISLFVFAACLKNKGFLLWTVVSAGVVQAVFVVMQQLGFMQSNHSMFVVTGLMGNPGQLGGFQAVSLICCLLLTRIEKRGVLIVSAVAILYSLIVSDSRAGWLAAVSGLIALYGRELFAHFKGRKIFFAFMALLLMGVMIGLYFYRSGSADARLLIWVVSSRIIADNPWSGVGQGMFRFVYMPYQAEYFAAHPDSRYLMVADNVAYPYNEFIRIAVEQGIVGLCLFLIVIVMVYRTAKDKSLLAPMAALLVFSCFSYPMDKPALAVMFPLLLGVPIKARGFKWMQRLSLSALAVAVAQFSFVIWFRTDNERLARNLKSEYNYRDDRMLSARLPYFKSDVRLNSSYFYLMRKYDAMWDEDMLEYVIPSCENYCEMGKHYLSHGDFSKAEYHFVQASRMIPTRLQPKYLLWKTYLETGRSTEAEGLAKIILSQHLKVENTVTLKIKSELRCYYNCNFE